MSARLCPAIPEIFKDAATNNIFFSDDEARKIDGFLKREDTKECATNIFFGIFFDGTKNNYVQGSEAGNQSNVARLYDCFPGQSVPGVLPDTVEWATNKDSYKNFYRMYIPGVASPFIQIGDTGQGRDKDRGAAFGALGEDRVKWALIQAMNNVHRFFHNGTPLFQTTEIKSLLDSIELTKWQRWRVGDRHIRADDDREERGKNTRKVFEELLQRLHKQVEMHWVDPATGKPKKIDPARVQTIYVSVFGFSRGAAQARAFANWFMSLCSLDAYLTKSADSHTLGGFKVEFDFLGLFDTVASVGIANTLGDSLLLSKFDGHGAWADAEDSLRVQNGIRCLHLVSAHEVRRSFPLDSISVKDSVPDNSEEIVFPGVHSDLGSGYCPGEQGRGMYPKGSDMLARIPLLYMYREARLAGVPLKLDMAADWVKEKFQVTMPTINALNAYLATCKEQTGTLTNIMREQGKRQILWHCARRANTALPLEQTKSFLRATNFDKNDLHSANIEFEDEIKDFEKWLAKNGKNFIASSQKPGFGNSYLNEWEEIATWWNNGEKLDSAALDFFDNYVHDSHAWFKLKDEFPDNETDFKKRLVEWEQRRRAAIVRSRQLQSHAVRGNQISETPEQIDRLTPEERIAAQEYAETGEIPRMMTSGREAETFLTLTLRGGYLRYRKVYAGADNFLISRHEHRRDSSLPEEAIA